MKDNHPVMIMEKINARAAFKDGLKRLINGYSQEARSNTPDRILASFLIDCMKSYEDAVIWRDEDREYHKATGQFHIGQYTLTHSTMGGIFITKQDGEGALFATETVEKAIEEFYAKNF